VAKRLDGNAPPPPWKDKKANVDAREREAAAMAKAMVLCVVSRPCHEYFGGRADTEIRELVEAAKGTQSLLELHDLSPQSTENYAHGCLWALAASEHEAQQSAVKFEAGRSNSSSAAITDRKEDLGLAQSRFGPVPRVFYRFVYELSGGNPNFIELVLTQMREKSLLYVQTSKKAGLAVQPSPRQLRKRSIVAKMPATSSELGAGGVYRISVSVIARPVATQA
jgi:hypothetical protein